ncbi:MAG TPA: gfo/Idh/MocA family oxidoreductase, partial [Isosphaeraceae bacterium]|nr:gfo/Idh/MocA family oxidoreductase [Isosphaeraceae bacterium]
AAFQSRTESGLDVVSAVALRLADGTPATLALSAVSPDSLFELTYFGENGLIRASDLAVEIKPAGGTTEIKNLPASSTSIDADFVQAVGANGSPCCPVDQALDTVRLLEAIVRSAASGQVVRVA